MGDNSTFTNLYFTVLTVADPEPLTLGVLET